MTLINIDCYIAFWFHTFSRLTMCDIRWQNLRIYRGCKARVRIFQRDNPWSWEGGIGGRIFTMGTDNSSVNQTVHATKVAMGNLAGFSSRVRQASIFLLNSSRRNRAWLLGSWSPCWDLFRIHTYSNTLQYLYVYKKHFPVTYLTIIFQTQQRVQKLFNILLKLQSKNK